MDKKKLSDINEQVTDAKAVLEKIEKLEEVAASCRSEVGFMEIRTMYKNDADTSLVDVLSNSKTVHDTFREAIGKAAETKVAELRAQFDALEIK